MRDQIERARDNAKRRTVPATSGSGRDHAILSPSSWRKKPLSQIWAAPVDKLRRVVE